MKKYLEKFIKLFLVLLITLQIYLPVYLVDAVEFPEVIKVPEVSKGNLNAEGKYEILLTDINPTGYSADTYLKNVNLNNEPLQIINGNDFETQQNGIFTKANSSFFYTDVQEQGYEFFEAYVGLDKSSLNTDASITFYIYLDGVLAYESKEIKSGSKIEHIYLDISKSKVIQLVVKNNNNSKYNYGVWGNAKFIKSAASPYLKVADLEFNLPAQVTESNILEYVKAYSVSGKNLHDDIVYKTDYKEGLTGNFTVTYTVTDEFGNKRTRTVSMIVTGEDYSHELSLDRLKKPWASYLYHGRNTLSIEGQKAWDVILKEVLDFKANKWKQVNRWGTDCYLIDIDLQALNIFVSKEELTNLVYMFQDDEPRSFILPDWDTVLTMNNGLVSHVNIYARKNLADNQDYWLEKIEANTVNMLSESKEDMNEAQRVYYVLKKYAGWIQYTSGQQLHEALGLGHSVCGGNARGTVFLTERLGVKSVFGRSGPHAWTYTKLYNYDAWFKNDLLAGPAILVDANSSKHNMLVGGNYLNRHYEWFSFSDKDYPREKFKYPSVWLTLDNSNILVLPKNKPYNLLDNVVDFGSIYEDNLVKEDINITITKLDEFGNAVTSNWEGLKESSDGSDLKAGDYIVTYTLISNKLEATATKKVRVTSGEEYYLKLKDSINKEGNVKENELVGLWNGTEEKWYQDAIETYENASISFDLSKDDYRYLNFDFGIKNSVRENTSYGFYGKVMIEVVIDDKVIYTSSILGWKDHYETITLQIPENSANLKLNVLAKGDGNNHAAIGNLALIVDDGSVEGIIEEEPEKPVEPPVEENPDIPENPSIEEKPEVPENPTIDSPSENTNEDKQEEQSNEIDQLPETNNSPLENSDNNLENEVENNENNSANNVNNNQNQEKDENISEEDESVNSSNNNQFDSSSSNEVKKDLQNNFYNNIFTIIIMGIAVVSALLIIIILRRKKSDY